MSGISADALRRAVAGEPVGREDARAFLAAFGEGDVSAEQLAAMLTALRIRGAMSDTLLGFVEAARAAMIPVRCDRPDAVDVCGTGGDGQGTVNISTASAFVVAACGVPVAKHGNHGVSSRCGSVDVLEALGVPARQSSDEVAASIEEHGLGFIYARAHHPLFAKAAPVRAALGFPTAFNLMGPLCNPAGVRRQLLGVASPEVQETVAAILAGTGCDRVLVVHTPGPYDEVTLTAPAEIRWVEGGEVRAERFAPEDFGTEPVAPADLVGGSAEANADRIERVLAGAPDDPLTRVVAATAACALLAAGRVGDVREGFAEASRALDSGAAHGKLEMLRTRT